MRSGLVAVDQASPRNCNSCGTALATGFLCTHCGRLQPLGSEENYFSVLGFAPRLQLDTVLLEKRFYELSRALHPDRFTTSDAENRRISTERMTLINDAYRNLKTSALRRSYFLKLFGFHSAANQKNPRIPVELAETWFELQDALAESPTEAASKLRGYEVELGEFRARKLQALLAIEAEVDAALDKLDPAQSAGTRSDAIAVLAEKLLAEVQGETYLDSMTQNMEHMKKPLL